MSLSNPIYLDKIDSNPAVIGGETYELQVPGDGSCLLHAICNAFCYVYITQTMNDKPINPIQFVKKLREQLAIKLNHVNEQDPAKRTFYESISRGSLPDLAENFLDKSLEGMQAHINSREPLGVEILEYISIIIGYDIFLVDKHKGDIYITGDEDLYQKGRSAIVVVYDERIRHYTTGAIKDFRGEYWSLFKPTHGFIQVLKRRQQEITS